MAGLPADRISTSSESRIRPMPEVGIPRLTGKAEYATRVVLPNMLYVKTAHQSASACQSKDAGCFEGGEDAGRGLYPDRRECAEDLSISQQSSSFRAKSWPLWRRKPRIWPKMPSRPSEWSMSFFLSRQPRSRPWRLMRP